ncbi:MAG: cysteine desulfurase-like protein [Woeseiaceae bacterium]
MSLHIDAVRAQFPSLSETDDGLRRIYMDNPGGTQVPLSVVQRISDCLLHGNANIGGNFRTSDLAGEIVDEGRAASADFLNARSPDEIMFGPNMTTLTLHLSRSIGRHLDAGDEIVLSKMEHDANISPWLLIARDYDLEVKWLPFNVETFEFDADALDDVLSERTRLVCIGGASNLTGTLNDVKSLCGKARAAGAWSFIDAVQSAPHELPDVQDFGCDFLACSAYKFFGPHQSILWGRRELLESLQPYKLRPAPEELPWRFETGTQSHEAIAGTGAAIDYFASLGDSVEAGSRRDRLVSGFTHMFEYEKLLSSRLIAGLQNIDGVIVHGITDPDAMDRRVPTVSFTHARHRPEVIAQALSQQNIFVWCGHNYAVEPVKALGLMESGGVVRVGPVHYNTVAEIDETLRVIEGAVA